MPDIFDQAASQTAAPPSSSPAQADIFDQAAIPQKSFSERIGERIGQNVNAPAHLLNHLPDIMQSVFKGEGNPIARGHNPLMGAALVTKKAVTDLFQEYKDDPAKLVGDIITIHATHGLGEEGEAAQASKRPIPAPAEAASKAGSLATDAVKVVSPTLARYVEAIRDGNFGKMVPERLQALDDIQAHWTGKKILPESLPPAPKPPGVPPEAIPQTGGVTWGQPGQGPLDLRGKMIPQGSPSAYENVQALRTPLTTERAMAARTAETSVATPAATAPSAQFPPRGPAGKFQYTPGTPAATGAPARPSFDIRGITRDIDEDKAIEDAMRADLEKHANISRIQSNREFAAGHSMDVPKGVQIEQAKNALMGGKLADIGAPNLASPGEPVELPTGLKLFKSGGEWFAKGGQWAKNNWTRVTASDLKSALSSTSQAAQPDLTEALQRSLGAARKK